MYAFFAIYYSLCYYNENPIAVVSSSEDESEYQGRKCYTIDTFLNSNY